MPVTIGETKNPLDAGFFVPRAGLEPARFFNRQRILSPSCLPIPPPRQVVWLYEPNLGYGILFPTQSVYTLRPRLTNKNHLNDFCS